MRGFHSAKIVPLIKMKLKQLEQELQQINTSFQTPKIEWEQYPTNAHLASLIAFTARDFGDVEDKTVIDLGIGCGMLTIATIMMGSLHNIGIDIDQDALAQAKANLEELEMDAELVLGNVVELEAKEENELLEELHLESKADTVIMNPPFGTKTKGVDMIFLRLAAKLSGEAIYSLHKTSTRDHVLKVGESLGFKGRVIAELTYDLPKTYKFHKKQSVSIQVDFIRFQKTTCAKR